MEKRGRVSIGIAGLGRSGWSIHAELLEKVKDLFQVSAVCDAMAGRRKEAEKRFACRTYEDFDGLLADDEVEVIVVATPSHLHSKHAVQALKAGMHVVCEKPMATSSKDAQSMIEAARETGRTLTVFQNYRYLPDVAKLLEVFKSGVLGRLVLAKIAVHGFGRRWDWQTLKKYGGGALNNTGPHFIDVALLLFGPNEPEVFCRMENVLSLGDAEDHVKLLLYAEGSPTIDIEITKACAYPQDRYLLMGTQGTLKGGPAGFRWKYFDPAELEPRTLDESPTPDRSYNSDTIPWKEETYTVPEDWTTPQAGFYRDLHRTLCQGAPLSVTPESVLRQIKIIEKCRELCPV